MSEEANDQPTTKERTISESVMGILEDFGESEPLCFIAVWLDRSGDVAINRTHARSTVEALGLLEAAKCMIGGYLLADERWGGGNGQ